MGGIAIAGETHSGQHELEDSSFGELQRRISSLARTTEQQPALPHPVEFDGSELVELCIGRAAAGSLIWDYLRMQWLEVYDVGLTPRADGSAEGWVAAYGLAAVHSTPDIRPGLFMVTKASPSGRITGVELSSSVLHRVANEWILGEDRTVLGAGDLAGKSRDPATPAEIKLLGRLAERLAQALPPPLAVAPIPAQRHESSPV